MKKIKNFIHKVLNKCGIYTKNDIGNIAVECFGIGVTATYIFLKAYADSINGCDKQEWIDKMYDAINIDSSNKSE